jgi:hypothetical protein
MGEMRFAYKILVGKIEGKMFLLEDIGVDGRVILK